MLSSGRTLVVLSASSLLTISPIALAEAMAAEERCMGRDAMIVGTDHADHILGTATADVILARGGDDRILGKGGNDVICSGKGSDVVHAGPGDDQVEDGDDPYSYSDGNEMFGVKGTTCCRGASRMIASTPGRATTSLSATIAPTLSTSRAPPTAWLLILQSVLPGGKAQT